MTTPISAPPATKGREMDMTTPIFDLTVRQHPYPAFSVDTAFRWETFAEAYAKKAAAPKSLAPKPGARPVRRKKSR